MELRKVLLAAALMFCTDVFSQTSGKQSIAVLDFQNESGVYKYNYLERTISESIITTFAGSDHFIVVERYSIDRILEEHKLGQAGILNTATAAKIGQMLGANQIVLGSFSAFGNNIQINTRLIDVNSGTIIKAGKYSGTDVPLLVDEVASHLLIELTPDEQEKMRVRRDWEMRKRLFQSQLKSPALAFIGGMTLPILGHAHVGTSANLIRGAVYTLVELLFINRAISNAGESSDDDMVMFIMLTGLTNVISGIDAGFSAVAYNKQLRQQGFSMGLGTCAGRKQYMLSINYHF